MTLVVSDQPIERTVDAINKEAAEQGFEVKTIEANYDPQESYSAIQTFVSQGVDGIINIAGENTDLEGRLPRRQGRRHPRRQHQRRRPSRGRHGQHQGAVGLLLSTFAAAFLGSATWRVGQFHLAGTAVGVFILGVVFSGLGIMDTPAWLNSVITGLILIAAIRLSKLLRPRN